MKAYFGLEKPPVNIAKFAIGDGTVGNGIVFNVVPTVACPPARIIQHTDESVFSFTANYCRDVSPSHQLRH